MCGLVGIYGAKNTFKKLRLAGSQIQNRGSDGTGVIFADGAHFIPRAPHRVLGEVAACMDSWPLGEIPEKALLGILHIRYGTSGVRDEWNNIQPFYVDSPHHGPFCFVHNGDTQKIEPVREELEKKGVVFSGTSDSEVLAHLIGRCTVTPLHEAVLEALHTVRSAYALIVATPSSLIAARDCYGYRPLSIGTFSDGGYIVASETSALTMVGAAYLRDVQPGEIVVIDKNGLHVVAEAARTYKPPHLARCVFEHVYFSGQTSRTFGQSVALYRHRAGERLAEEYLAQHGSLPKEALLVPVPDSGNHYAQGFSHRAKHPLTFAITRARRPSRSFIGANEEEREARIRFKFSVIPEFVRGKHCFLVDDSLVRGKTMRILIVMLREAGATGVTVFIGSPPIVNPCLYGVDFKTYAELLAARLGMDMDAMRKSIGADGLSYLSMEGFLVVIGLTFGTTDDSCLACFNGKYAL